MKLYLGSGRWRSEGWVTVDIDPAKHPNLVWDLRELPYPFETRTADLIFTSHTVEHLSYRQAGAFFQECYRILKPEGALRVTVPDFETAIHRYAEGKFIEWYLSLKVAREFVKNHATSLETIGKEFFYPGSAEDHHRSAWDRETLKYYFEQAGFSEVVESFFRRSQLEAFQAKGLDNRPLHTLFMEGFKR